MPRLMGCWTRLLVELQKVLRRPTAKFLQSILIYFEGGRTVVIPDLRLTGSKLQSAAQNLRSSTESVVHCSTAWNAISRHRGHTHGETNSVTTNGHNM